MFDETKYKIMIFAQSTTLKRMSFPLKLIYELPFLMIAKKKQFVYKITLLWFITLSTKTILKVIIFMENMKKFIQPLIYWNMECNAINLKMGLLQP